MLHPLKPLLATALLALAAGSAQAADAPASDALQQDATQQAAIAIHAKHPTLDNHVDIPFDFGRNDPGIDGPGQFDLAKAKRGQLHGAALAIFVPQNARTADGYREAAEKAGQKLVAIESMVARYPDRAAIAHTPAEFRQLAEDGKFAVILSILNGNMLGLSLTAIDAWHERGVRMFGFVHAGNNDLVDSSRPNLLRGDRQDEHGGLSPLGRELVGRLNDLGMVIDVSQMTGKALAQLLEQSRAPVVASHSNARSIIDHPRNLSDEQLQAIRAKGGVVAVNAYSSWVRAFPAEAIAKLNEVRRDYGVPEEATPAGIQPVSDKGVPVLPLERFREYSDRFHAITGSPDYRATLAEYVDQIDYVVSKIGVDHVGISSDFNHGGGVIGWKDVGESVNLTAELLKRGYSEADIAKLWGGNFLRVWQQAQDLAQR